MPQLPEYHSKYLAQKTSFLTNQKRPTIFTAYISESLTHHKPNADFTHKSRSEQTGISDIPLASKLNQAISSDNKVLSSTIFSRMNLTRAKCGSQLTDDNLKCQLHAAMASIKADIERLCKDKKKKKSSHINKIMYSHSYLIKKKKVKISATIQVVTICLYVKNICCLKKVIFEDDRPSLSLKFLKVVQENMLNPPDVV